MIRVTQKKLFGLDLEEYKVDRRIERINNQYDQVLVIGANSGVYVYDGKKISKIAERDGSVVALVVLDGKLYDVAAEGKNRIYETLSSRVIARRDEDISALTVYNGKLYDATGEFPKAWGKIYETLSNKVIAEREGWICVLTVINGELYDAGYSGIYKTLSNTLIAERDFGTCALISDDNGKIYDAGYYGVYETLSNKIIVNGRKEIRHLAFVKGKLYYATSSAFKGRIYEALNDKAIAERDGRILAMIATEKEIYDAGFYGVYKISFDDQGNIIEEKQIFDKEATSLLIVDRSVVKIWRE